jgi:hypothetical protein
MIRSPVSAVDAARARIRYARRVVAERSALDFMSAHTNINSSIVNSP